MFRFFLVLQYGLKFNGYPDFLKHYIMSGKKIRVSE